MAHGSPLNGDWFPNPTGLLLGAFGLPAHHMSHSPLPHPGTGPFPASYGLPTPSGRCAALATRPSLPRPLVPSSRVYTPPGRQQPCGAGPLDPLPSGACFVRLAGVAPFPPLSLSPVPRPRPNPLGCCAAPSHPSSRVYTPPGRQQPCGADPLDPHPSGDRFVHLARVVPFPPFSPVPRPRSNPLGCCTAPSHPSSRVYTLPGRQQPCGAGPLDPHPSGDRFVRLERVAPLPPPPLTLVPPPSSQSNVVYYAKCPQGRRLGHHLLRLKKRLSKAPGPHISGCTIGPKCCLCPLNNRSGTPLPYFEGAGCENRDCRDTQIVTHTICNIRMHQNLPFLHEKTAKNGRFFVADKQLKTPHLL